MTKHLTVGPVGLALIEHFEGLRTRAYLCSAGVPTIGIGSTRYADGTKVKLGDTITEEAARELFAVTLERDYAEVVRQAVAGVPTSAAQFGALTALCYNIGPGPRIWIPGRKKGFRQSQVLKLHRAGDYEGAGKAFMGWTLAGGKRSAGLVRRRSAEAALYLRDWDELRRTTHGKVNP